MLKLVAARAYPPKHRARTWLAGRLSLYWSTAPNYRDLAELQWTAGANLWLLGFCYEGCEHKLRLSLAAGPHLSLSVQLPRRPWWERQIARLRALARADSWDGVDVVQISVHDRTLWWSILHPDMSWTAGTARWRSGNYCPIDHLLGCRDVTTETLSQHAVLIAMPEGNYEWNIELQRRTWRRPRWPWWPALNVIYSHKSDACDGHQIPIPGKGENSWDCGADAIFGQSAPAETLADAISSVVRSALHDRHRRGAKLGYREGGRHDDSKAA